MLTDGITLLEGSSIKNATISSGSSFPNEPSTGELFYKTNESTLYVYDGNGWTTLATRIYDLAFFTPGLLGSGNVFLTVVTRSFKLPANLIGSIARAVTPAAGNTTMTLYQKIGDTAPSSIGSIVFGTGNTVATITFNSDVTFSVGDTFIIGVASADQTLADVSVTLNALLV